MTPEPRPALDWASQQALVVRLTKTGDPLADDAVERLDRQVDRAGRLYRLVMDEVSAGNDPSHAWLDAHFDERPRLPGWIDQDLLREGQALYRSQPWSLNVAFMLASLPMSYCGAVGSEVLEWTGFLERDPQRRVYETSLLVMELAEEGGLHDGADGEEPGKGYLTLLRVRLLHAATRRALTDYGVSFPDGDRVWDVRTKGVPACQLDLLGTMWSFALSSVAALNRARPGKEIGDLRGWIHLWCVVGHLLGIADDEEVGALLPMEPDEAQACFDAVQKERFGPSTAGQALARSLIDLAHEQLPGKDTDALVEAMIRANLGDEYADHLGIRRVEDGALLERAQTWWRKATKAPRGGRLVPSPGKWRMQRFLLRGVAQHLSDPHADPFRPPKANNDLLRSYHSMVVWRMAWYRRLRRTRLSPRRGEDGRRGGRPG